eukprot:8902147-Pyramimonas_sp.AAC.1
MWSPSFLASKSTALALTQERKVPGRYDALCKMLALLVVEEKALTALRSPACMISRKSKPRRAALAS